MDLNSPTSLCMQVTVEKPKKVKHSAVCSATSLWGATPWGLAGLIANLKWSVSKVMTSGDILYELIVMCLIQHLTKSHFSKSFSFREHYGIICAGACSEASIQARLEGHSAGYGRMLHALLGSECKKWILTGSRINSTNSGSTRMKKSGLAKRLSPKWPEEQVPVWLFQWSHRSYTSQRELPG